MEKLKLIAAAILACILFCIVDEDELEAPE